jgi:ribosomal protein S8
MPRITIVFTNRSYNLIKLLYNLRVIQNYFVLSKNEKKYVVFNSYYYKNTPFFSHFRTVSTPSKPHSISLKALKIVNKSLGNSIILLETDKGVIAHSSALSHKIGGKIIGVIS